MSNPQHKPVIVFSGGGSGGHLFPLVTVMEAVNELSRFHTIYFGRNHPLENETITGKVDKTIHISTGKLRRYFSWQNLTDIFKIFWGLLTAFFNLFIIKIKNKKIVIFSTGGFAAVPVVLAGAVLRIPIVIHEQTSRAGLANKICGFFAKKICLSLSTSQEMFNLKKTEVVGFPLRKEFYQTEIKFSLNSLSQFFRNHQSDKFKYVLFSGGGNGSKLINDIVLKNFEGLSKEFKIIHQTGKHFFEEFKNIKNKNYYPLGFISKEDWISLLKKVDIVVSRSGAGIVHETVFLKKPSIFIPLSIAQKNEQYYNALYAEEIIASMMVKEKEVGNQNWVNLIKSISKKTKNIKSKDNSSTMNAMTAKEVDNLKPTDKIINILEKILN